MTHTRLDGRYAIRLVIGQRATERRHVEEAWRLIREAAMSP
jgi:aromatic-L-amino-acid decarboxylase